MTLVLAVPAMDGVVLASDSQVTAGAVRRRERKVRPFNDHCLWSAAGDLALIQRVEEGVAAIQVNEPLHQLRDQIASVVRQMVDTLLQLDFRTKFVHDNPDLMLQLHPGDFVLVEYLDAARILNIRSDGTSLWVRNSAYPTGNGDLFAYALLQKFEAVIPKLSVAKAGLLAYRVIEEVIQVGSYGVGPPIDVWQITQDGIENLSEEKIVGLADTSKLLRDAELRAFLEE